MISRDSQTPEKQYANHTNKKIQLEQFLTRDLFSPCASNFLMVPALHTHRKQPDYLLSPSPIKKDLFAQLLGTQTKHNSLTLEEKQIIQQPNDSQFEQQSSEINDEDQSNMEEFQSDQQHHWMDENGLRKRKRKSTAQIKMLKQQLEVQENWSKQNIVKMAKLTGLSQSQVYKWFWDQKKKNKAKQVKVSCFRRRIICKQKKPNQNCQNLHQKTHKFIQQNQEEIQKGGKQNFQFHNQKGTEKKINKRLVFH